MSTAQEHKFRLPKIPCSDVEAFSQDLRSFPSKTIVSQGSFNTFVGTPEQQVHREVGSGILQANKRSDYILEL